MIQIYQNEELNDVLFQGESLDEWQQIAQELKMDKQLVNNEEYIKMLEKNSNINQDRKNKHTYRAGEQFYVHKDLILRNSKKVYEDFYNYLMNSNIGSFSTGRFFEYTWHIIFTHGLNDIE